jgi:hypothetical protein
MPPNEQSAHSKSLHHCPCLQSQQKLPITLVGLSHPARQLQAVLTLNLLRGLRINPKLSAWAQINGPYDCNSTPIEPPGIQVIAYEPQTQIHRSKLNALFISKGKNSIKCWSKEPILSFDLCCLHNWLHPSKLVVHCRGIKDHHLSSLNVHSCDVVFQLCHHVTVSPVAFKLKAI